MNTNKPGNSYDDTKKMLKTIRNLQESAKDKKVMSEQISYGEEAVDDDNLMLQKDAVADEREQQMLKASETQPQIAPPQPNTDVQTFDRSPGRPEEDSDYAVINDVEVVIHSEDPEDM